MTTTNTASIIYHDFNQFGMQDSDPTIVETIDPERVRKAIMRRKINKRRNKIACVISFLFAMAFVLGATAIELLLTVALINPSNYLFLGIGIFVVLINTLIGGFGYEYIEERIYHKNRY